MSETPGMEALRYADGSITYPPHPVGPDGSEPVESVDLSQYEAEVVTWTTSYATPPGVRQPNTIAVVEFDVDGTSVRAIGGVVDDAEVTTGGTIRPVYVQELRDPEVGIKEPASHTWDGFRFEPVEKTE
jgi:uncharacterized OB-fold protein